MPVYNKLIRDRILEIIEADGLSYNARTLAPEEHLTEIKKKVGQVQSRFKRDMKKRKNLTRRQMNKMQ